MTNPSRRGKRAQLEAQGWRFSAIPRFFAEGLMHNPKTGWKSPAYYDHKHPEAWIVTPPDGLPIKQKRFEHTGPALAVRWAWEQAQAVPLGNGLSGLAAITDLMNKARHTGVVAEAADDPAMIAERPDGHLISLCIDALAGDRIAEKLRDEWIPPAPIEGVKYGQHPVYKAHMARYHEAYRLKKETLPLLIDLQATTIDGLVAKAKVMEALGEARSGKQAFALSLARDVLTVLARLRLADGRTA